MKKSDFHYELPPELIAQAPLPERSASRLLVVPPAPAPFVDGGIRDLPRLLQPGDLLVFNDTRVIPARLHGSKASGGRVEILIERLLPGDEARAQVGASKSPKPGSRIALDAGGEAEVLGRDGEFYRLRFHVGEALDAWLQHAGRLPLPPYIHREPGVDDLAEHRMHSEWLNVGAQLVEKVRHTRANGGRVVAIGTTVVRALESAMAGDELQPFAGETSIFILPGVRVRSIDALLTNFHLPESTLLMLVSAFAGKERIFAAYEHAVRERYRFFSYGDAMLLYPQAGQGA